VRPKLDAGARRLPVFTSVTTLRVDAGIVSVFATDPGGNVVYSVGKDGQTSTVIAGSSDGAAGFNGGRRNASKLRAPQSVCVLSLTGKTDKQNRREQVPPAFQKMLVVSDTGNHCVRFITVQAQAQQQQIDHLGADIRVLAGRSAVPGSSDGNGTAASFRSPRGVVAVTFAPQDNEDTRVFARSNVESLVVCDTENHVLRVVFYVGGMADDGGRTNPGAGSGAFMVHTLAGEAGRPGSEDGSALDGARLTFPTEITCDEESGSLFFVENGKAPAVRMYCDRSGRVTTITRSDLMKNPAGLCVEKSRGAGGSSSSSSSSNNNNNSRPSLTLLVCDTDAGCIWSLDVSSGILAVKISLENIVPSLLSAPLVLGADYGYATSSSHEGSGFAPVAIHCADAGLYVISDESRPGMLLRYLDEKTLRTAVEKSRPAFNSLETACAEYEACFRLYVDALRRTIESVMLSRMVTGGLRKTLDDLLLIDLHRACFIFFSQPLF
jgi:hypothetical protein